jgi:uncharacterized repeat protein (TIGR03803 family)
MKFQTDSASMPVIWRLALAIVILLAALTSAKATSTVVHSFAGGSDGKTPSTSLIFDTAGNLYGATNIGGSGACSFGCGSVFELSPAAGGGWTESVIYSFQGSGASDGAFPTGALTMDVAGNIYGVTSGGGSNGCGTVYRLSPNGSAWTESVLYSFCANGSTVDGSTPVGKVVQFDSAGNLYGVTAGGGAHSTGVVYMLVPTAVGLWTQTLLYSFPAASGSLGNEPAGIIFDSAGTLWGVTTFGGSPGVNGAGVVFQLAKNTSGDWTQKLIHAFSINGASLQTPTGGLVFDASGNLYMTMSRGGFGGPGVFELTPTAGGNYQGHLLHSFPGPHVVQPYESLTFDSAGNLYSAGAVGGGSCGCGLVYQLSPGASGWTATILQSMNGTSGNQPVGGVVLDSLHDIFVATRLGGAHKAGVVMEITP